MLKITEIENGNVQLDVCMDANHVALVFYKKKTRDILKIKKETFMKIAKVIFDSMPTEEPSTPPVD